MRLVRSIAALVAAILILGAGASATLAAPTAECQAAFDTLVADTTRDVFANDKSFASAVGKLEQAAAKIGEGKDADAAAKVSEFGDLLTGLVNAPKPKVADVEAAQALIAQAQAVEDCLAPVTTS